MEKFGNDDFSLFCDDYGIISPSYGSSKDTKTRVQRTPFGDGYSQRSGDGINNVIDFWKLSWDLLSIQKINLLEKYFRSRMGYKSFQWSAIRDIDERPKRFISESWNRGFVGAQDDSFSVTIEEVFDLL